jgi:hypothetical protein
MLLADLPHELHIQILEAGCDQDDGRMIREQPQGSPRSMMDWHVFNRGSARRLKRFCISMCAVSRYWHRIITDMSWCWFLDVEFPGFTFSAKYDLCAEIAQCKANLNASKDCDINVTHNYQASKTGRGVIRTPEGSQLMLHALAMLHPYAHRIRALHITPWSLEALATIIVLLKSFGPMPRLLAFGLSDIRVPWEDTHEAGHLEAPKGNILHLPQHCDEVEVRDASLLARVTWYETRFLSTEMIMPANLVTLIANLANIPTIALSAVVGSLSQLPTLEILNLCLPRGDTIDPSFATVSHTRLWTLNHLREFDLDVDHSKMFWALISRFDLPKLEYIRIFGTYNQEWNDDCAPNPIPSNPIWLPSLDSFFYYYFPAHSGTPLQYVEAPILDSANYVTNHWPPLTPPPSPPISPPPSSRPTLAQLYISSEIVGQNKYPELIRLIAQHDLSRTHLIYMVGSHSGDEERNDDEGGIEVEGLPGNARRRMLFTKCIADWLSDTSVSLGPSHSTAALKLRSIHARYFDCIHVLFFICAHLSPSPLLESISLDHFRNCDTHMEAQGMHRDHHGAAMSGIARLEIGTQSLNPTVNDIMSAHPLSAFPNLQILIVKFTCELLHCSLQPDTLGEHRKRLEYQDLLASLPQLKQLFLGLPAVHENFGDTVSFHSNLRGLAREMTGTIRRICLCRNRLHVPLISEVYLTVYDWRKSTWKSVSPPISMRLR